MEWYLKVLKNYATFTGRARRKEYWMFVLFNIIISIILSILDSAFGLEYGDSINKNGVLGSIYSLFVLIPTLAVSVRRLHDINKPGWLIALFYGIIIFSGLIIFIVPSIISLVLFVLIILGVSIYMIVLFATNGDVGSNQYGPDPKDPDSKMSNDDLLDDTL